MFLFFMNEAKSKGTPSQEATSGPNPNLSEADSGGLGAKPPERP